MNYTLLQFMYKFIHQHDAIFSPTQHHINATVVESSSN